MEVHSTKIMPFLLKKKNISAEIWQHVGFPKPSAKSSGGDHSPSLFGPAKPPVPHARRHPAVWSAAPYLPQPSRAAPLHRTRQPQDVCHHPAPRSSSRKRPVPAPACPSPPLAPVRHTAAEQGMDPVTLFLGLNLTVLPPKVNQQRSEPAVPHRRGKLMSQKCL